MSRHYYGTCDRCGAHWDTNHPTARATYGITEPNGMHPDLCPGCLDELAEWYKAKAPGSGSMTGTCPRWAPETTDRCELPVGHSGAHERRLFEPNGLASVGITIRTWYP